jgi:glycerol-3-phosphate cytidylyltransferase
MKIILTYGTFDLLHVGHIRLLERARALGDYLIVGLSTDEFNAHKGKRAIFGYEARREILMALRLVDEVIPERCWDQKREDIRDKNASLLVMGDDWRGEFDELTDAVNVVYLPRTEAISTTDIKTFIRKDEIDALRYNNRHTLLANKPLLPL